MSKPKKILNDPANVVSESIEGLVAASDGRLTRLGERNAVYRSDLPAGKGKVALVIGGGSGHEPMFPGFVGENLADASACGEVFAAPAPDLILDTVKAVYRGAGALFIYGNYSGDNMNFDIAAELAEAEGILTRTVRVWDDVAAAPLERITDRRGIAGDFFVIKVAGAAAAELTDLDEGSASQNCAASAFRRLTACSQSVCLMRSMSNVVESERPTSRRRSRNR